MTRGRFHAPFFIELIYENIQEGVFLSRPNRFIANVLTEGRETAVHVKNTGRLRELLVSGCRVYLEPAKSPGRKTPYDLIAVEHGGGIVNIDSQAPNKIAADWLSKSGLYSPSANIRLEVKKGDSRLDIFVEDGSRKAYMEVKGVTLFKGDTALFPDAPTERGIKHIRELIAAAEEGFEACMIFVIKRTGAARFSPNEITHPEFAKALRRAKKAGVRIIALSCAVTPSSIEATDTVPVEL